MLHSSPDRRQPTVLASQRGTSGNNASEVQTFAAYAGITDITQISALDYLVDNLKSTGLWSKMHFIYPFIGGNATSHKYELIDPSNSSRELVFTGVTHNSTGITGTASANANAVSGINATTHNTNNFSMGYYGTLKGSTTTTPNESGVMYLSSRTFLSFLTTSTSTVISYGPTATTLTNIPTPDGFKALSSTSTTTGNYFFNQINYSALTKGNTALTGFYGHELSRTTNSAVNTVSFSYASTQLTEAELVTLNTIVEQYQTILGRNSYYINPDYNPYTNRFIFNSTPSSFTEDEKSAINYLVSNLRSGLNIWDKLSFIHPFVSASNQAAALKELKSLGTTGAGISGLVNQSTLGVEASNTTSFLGYAANFGLAIGGPRTILIHVQEDGQSVGFEFNGTVAARNTLNVRNTSNQFAIGMLGNTSTIANTDARGLYIMAVPYVASTNYTVYKNGVSLGTATTGTSLTNNGLTYFLGYGTSSMRRQGFYAGANSYLFTTAEIAEANSIITTFLQMLGRT
jgi:hypothetical protein